MNLIIFPLSLISIFHDDSVNPIGPTKLRRHPLNMMCVFLFLDRLTQDCFFLCREPCCVDSPGCFGSPAHSSVAVLGPCCRKDALRGHILSWGVSDLRTGSGYSNLAEYLPSVCGGRK